MSKVEKYREGQFCWVDLNSKDQPKAEAFYTELFGWDLQKSEVPGGHYSMFLFKGEPVAGGGQMQPEPLTLRPVEALRSVVLEYEKAHAPGLEADRSYLTLALVSLFHFEPEHVSVPREAGFDVIGRQRRPYVEQIESHVGGLHTC